MQGAAVLIDTVAPSGGFGKKNRAPGFKVPDDNMGTRRTTPTGATAPVPANAPDWPFKRGAP
jgi:hypothetical protein